MITYARVIPIASGVDQGACRQFSEDRMEAQRDEVDFSIGASKPCLNVTGSRSKSDHWRGFLDENRVQQRVRQPPIGTEHSR